MTVRVISNDGAPDWTPRDWERFLAQTEEKQANSVAGIPNADGSRSVVFADGLTSLREHVAALRDEVNQMEAQLK